MNRRTGLVLAAALLFAMSVSLRAAEDAAPAAAKAKASTSASSGGGASADELFQKINNLRPPPVDRNRINEPAYRQEYVKERQKVLDERLALCKEFADKFPDDKRSADMLAFAAQMTSDPAQQAALDRRIVEKYPDSTAAKSSKGRLRQTDAIGKPFELSFTDAISGKEISMKDLKGKVVVIDFWATWCGPCVGEMPHMKELYAQYHPKGVEFIGVSLDQPKEEGGLDALKKFVAENDIKWPQYFQGKGWESEFSKGWGINSIPTMFLVDKQGNLKSTEARGKLETLLPQALGEGSASSQ
jgi:thiol-disulfide isomerase/thioredoxin